MNAELRRSAGRTRPLVPLAVIVLLGVFAAVATAAVPSNTAPPTVTGSAREGQTLTAHNGTWANAPTSFGYQWQRCSAAGTDCAGISGATARRYTAVAADVDRRLRVVVTASNADGQSSANSAPSDVISGGNAPTLTAKPTVSGSAIVGEELTASNGSWTGGATSFSFQWQRCDRTGAACVDVTDATARRYGVRTADVGRRLRVEVTARNASSSSTAASDPTALVRPSGGPAVRPNRAPTIRLLTLRRAGARLVARFRVCDDSVRPVTIVHRDLRFGVRPATRRFARNVRPCRVLVRNWMPPARFRNGKYTTTLRAVDRSGKSSRTVRRSLFL
jgi:hypothetical protein